MPGTNASTSQFDVSFTPSPSAIPRQKEDYNTYNKQFTDFLGSQATVPQLMDRYNTMFGVPDLQERNLREGEQLDSIGNMIRTMPDSVAQGSRNSILSQGQKDRVVQSRTAPLQESYNTLALANGRTGERLTAAEGNVKAFISAEQAQQVKMIAPWLQKYDAMTIQNAAENTQWTVSNQMELNRLLANQSAGLTWTNAEAQRAHELSMQENAFRNQLELMDKQNEFALDLWG